MTIFNTNTLLDQIQEALDRDDLDSAIDILVALKPADQARVFDPRAFSVSTFVISVRNVWFLITAGHVLRDVERRLKDGRQIV